jgi:Cu(I)/Ag(I) efflux system membrane protein CusA/SilA
LLLIALPMRGGLVWLTLLTLFVVPAVYVMWRSFQVRRTAKVRVGNLGNGGQ